MHFLYILYNKTNLPSILDVLVDNSGNGHGDEGKVPAGHEHDGQAHDDPEHGEGPVVVLEPRTPIRSPGKKKKFHEKKELSLI